MRGLERGRDEDAMEALMAEIRSPKDAAMMNIIVSDRVYTPARAHIRWGVVGGCPPCAAPQCDWLHDINDCPHTTPGSRQMAATACWGPQDSVAGGGEVATDGSSRGPKRVCRAGWGLCWGEADACNNSGAVIGRTQTAARADAYAVAQVVAVADAAVEVISDNKGVWNKLQQLKKLQRVEGARQADWDQIARRVHRLHAVHWIKAHLDPVAAEAAAAPDTLACTQSRHGCTCDARSRNTN